MSFHNAALVLRLIATHSCRSRKVPSHYHIRLPSPLMRPTAAPRRHAITVAEQGSGSAGAVLVRVPTPEALDEGETELLDASDAQLQITERAAEKLRDIAMEEGNTALSLRVEVESGGCHGYQYKMKLTEEIAPDDYQFSHPTHQPSSIVIDAVSLGLLKGSTVDYATELIGSSFRVVDNPQAKGNGCGCGISWEAKF